MCIHWLGQVVGSFVGWFLPFQGWMCTVQLVGVCQCLGSVAMQSLVHERSEKDIYDAGSVRHLFKQSDKTYLNFLKKEKKLKQKQEQSVCFLFNSGKKVNLSKSQKLVKEVLLSQVKNRFKQQRLISVFALPGNGKSFLINHLREILDKEGFENIALGPTGVSSSNLDSQTVHSYFGVPYKSGLDFQQLSHKYIPLPIQKKLSKLKILILDEISFFSCALLNFVNHRLQKVFKNQRPFGGISCYAFGDWGQLLAPFGAPLFANPTSLTCAFNREGAELIRKFEVFQLYENIRQQEDHKFQSLLQSIRSKQVSPEDFRAIQQRHWSNLSDQEVASFESAQHIFPYNSLVDDFNYRLLLNSEQPIVKIPPFQFPAEPKVLQSQTLYLSPGASVFLTANLYTEEHLVSGSQGTVHSILYKKGHIPGENFPVVILVQFPKYTGRCVEFDCVPVPPVSESYFDPASKIKFKIKTFPLRLGTAVTGHRCQSLTISKASIYLSERESFLGQSLVCLSRVQRLEDLMIIGPLPENRFNCQSFFSGFENFKRCMSDFGLENQFAPSFAKIEFNRKDEPEQQQCKDAIL